MSQTESWSKHAYRVGQERFSSDTPPEDAKAVSEHRRKIEPWLSAVFQSEHLSLLVGNGFPRAVSLAAGAAGVASMDAVKMETKFADSINAHARRLAEAARRGAPNIEDQIRAASALAEGLQILGKDKDAAEVHAATKAVLKQLVADVLTCEGAIRQQVEGKAGDGLEANRLLCSFLLSFASRAASRERLHVFTTNYDRLIEYACDWMGLRVVDRFIGYLSPIYRSSRVDVDMHYNPPGIRGEPRYLEGVLKLTKLHGSPDWRYRDSLVRRIALPFGLDPASCDLSDADLVLVYPNAAKDVETVQYPYADLFRDYAAALCRPNSALVTYGYGFGDEHVNRVIRDMLTIPSTHLVIISWDDPGRDDKTSQEGRITTFCRGVGRDAQISLLLGEHFGDLANLVDHYLPKPAIDHITIRKARLEEHRGTRAAPDGGPARLAEAAVPSETQLPVPEDEAAEEKKE